jgi:hypothetical protein
MVDRRWSRSHAALSLALASTMAIIGSGVAAADSGHGQHGHYLFIDGDATHTGATCVYTGPQTKLTSLVVKPPKVWWPDTNAANERQHGTVGWKVIVQKAEDAVKGPWTVAKQSSVQKKVAYEDQTALYGESTKAPFTKKTLSWSAPQSPTIYVRVIVQAFWYNPDGSVLGWQKHRVVWYHYTYGASSGTFTNLCNNYGLAG